MLTVHKKTGRWGSVRFEITRAIGGRTRDGGYRRTCGSERLMVFVQLLALLAFAVERRDGGRDGYNEHNADEKRKHR